MAFCPLLVSTSSADICSPLPPSSRMRACLLRSNRKPVLVGSYPTEVQAAVAHDDATRQALLAPVIASTPSASAVLPVVVSLAAGTAGATPAAPVSVAPAPSPALAPPTKEALSPTYNFASDEEARERLDAVAIFEAGLEADGVAEVDPSLLLVVGKDGKVRLKSGGGGLGSSDEGGKEEEEKGKEKEKENGEAGGGDTPAVVAADSSEGASSQAGSANASAGVSAEGVSAEKRRGDEEQRRIRGEQLGAAGVVDVESDPGGRRPSAASEGGGNGGVLGGRGGGGANGTPMDVDEGGGFPVNGGGVYEGGGNGHARYDRVCYKILLFRVVYLYRSRARARVYS